MPKLIIELDADTHKKLKLQAINDDRSLNKYLTRGLIYLANMPVPYYKSEAFISALPDKIKGDDDTCQN